MTLFLRDFPNAKIFNLIIKKGISFIFRSCVCYYKFTHLSGRIKVTFSYIDLEDGFDYVEIYDGKKVGY